MYALPYEDTVVMLLVALSNKVSNKAGQYACAFVGRKDTVTFVDPLITTYARQGRFRSTARHKNNILHERRYYVRTGRRHMPLCVRACMSVY